MCLVELLKKDVRFQEGLNTCINCGTCTAICPAARFYNYDPRIIVDTVQSCDEVDILALLESDTIWYCGECLSCKTRCPRNNTPGYSLANSKIKFESMEPYKPDFIVANCPGCTFFLDRWQYVIAEMTGKIYGIDGYGIPVLTYEEMAGLVLGMDTLDLGMQLHQVSVEPLLDKMGIEYDLSKKHSGYMNEDIGKPGKPETLRI